MTNLPISHHRWWIGMTAGEVAGGARDTGSGTV